ncbi:hypothetical protein J2752_002686 [Halarchaeum rubridurum]|uniref:Cell division protein A N-terminal domain-containing protein n=1 Tax=Halarchaeum rubridurum TaxID=489911 RepID=A0A830G489_9EURY|nr:sulfite exporter TauE/SafE family protein [Halarchaeum rubridurum]MBP1955757.1 hypothetical protein [Halarchaeum rubridurum]GGM74783.1 hypothetical protein GCM10009017_25930 [Halarchaeum rubridurum]
MESETTERVTDELVRVYRRYLGEPERLADVYVGFGLFFAGVTLGVLGAVVFGWSSTIPASVHFHWQLREVAGTLALVGLPAFLLSIPVLLPVDRRAMYAAGLGAVVCLGGVGVFVASYPQHWNVQGTADYSTLGVFVYSAGLVVLVGAGGAGLVTDRIERARQSASAAANGGGGEDGNDATGATGGSGSAGAETVSDEQVERDIEDAMSSSELSWGGVEKTKTTRLNLSAGTDDEEVERSNLTPDNANVSRSTGADDQVAALQKLRGNEEPAEETGEGADDQVAALQELRKKQQAEEVATADDDGVVDRVKSLFGR